ncbi:MAG: hypothetical protein R6W94_14720, partial [Spirochaetia bacterium]
IDRQREKYDRMEIAFIRYILWRETYRDTYLELFALWLEVNFSDVAFFLGSAARWSTGRENGLLEQGMLDAGDFGPFLTLGTLVKWQR